MNAEERLKALSATLGLVDLTNLELLQAFASILELLRDRGLVRTSNNPVADYTEWLVCSRLGLMPERSSNRGYDGIAPDGTKYEIKARRVTSHNSSLQLSAIRGLRDRHFDYLIGVVYEADFSIRYAAKVPHALIEPNSKFRSHTNSHAFHLRPEVLSLPGVEDLTGILAA